MPTPKKNETIEQIAEALKTANGVFLADYSGLTVEMMTNLRKRCHAQSVSFRVVKNTLALRAAREAGLPDLDEWMGGSTVIAYAEDPSLPVKLLQSFVREVREANGRPAIKKGFVSGQLLSDADLEILANLPVPEVVRAKFVGVLKSPAGKLVGLLAAAPGALARILDQRRQQLENQSDSSEAGSSESSSDASA